MKYEKTTRPQVLTFLGEIHAALGTLASFILHHIRVHRTSVLSRLSTLVLFGLVATGYAQADSKDKRERSEHRDFVEGFHGFMGTAFLAAFHNPVGTLSL